MRKHQIIFSCLTFLLCLTALSAQNKTEQRRVVRIGGVENFPPFEFLDPTGNPDGFNVELTKAVAEVMDFDVEFKMGKWSEVTAWLNSGEIDVIQRMPYSQHQSRFYEFSIPHSEAWDCFFVRKNSTAKPHSELMNGKIVMQEGDVKPEKFKDIQFTGTIFYVSSQAEALQLLSEGKFDGAVAAFRHGMYILRAKKLTNLKPLDEPFSPQFYCFAAKKANSLLMNDFNIGLSILREKGKYYEIQKKWLAGETLSSISQRMFIRKLLYLVIPMFVFFLVALIWLMHQRKKISRKAKVMQIELQNRLKYESELNREYKMFVNGPVIVYKLMSEPFQISYISENVSQLGYDAKQLISQKKSFSDLIFTEDRTNLLQQITEELQDNKEFSSKQYRVVTADGKVKWVFDYMLIVREPEKIPWFYGYMLDITNQKTLEAELLEAKGKAEAANTSKGYFLSNISHEIRTPLNGIIGFIQVLQNTEFNEAQREYMDMISLASRTLMKIVNDILDFSKMESGMLDLMVTDFNAKYLIEDIIKTYSASSAKPNVDLRMRVGNNLPATVYGDMMRLRQILINLLQNALKFTESGFVEIAVDVYSQTEDSVRLLFSVKDTGIGIDPLKQKDIFDNFIQDEVNITRQYGGTGLGLSIVKKLVTLMGGFIWVESELNKGSNFLLIINFRTKMPDRSLYEISADEKVRSDEPLPALKVLLVEDEPINQLVTKRQLEHWNLNVTAADTGKEAIELLLENNFDCILMDVRMPEMDGITATHFIRSSEKGTDKHVPIIAFTASAMAGDKERFLAAGMDEYISKPIDIDYLYQLLKKVTPLQNR